MGASAAMDVQLQYRTALAASLGPAWEEISAAPSGMPSASSLDFPRASAHAKTPSPPASVAALYPQHPPASQGTFACGSTSLLPDSGFCQKGGARRLAGGSPASSSGQLPQRSSGPASPSGPARSSLSNRGSPASTAGLT